MAESIAQITSGAGPKLHTFQRTVGANSVEDEVVVQGIPYLPTYVTEDGAAMNTTTTAKHMWQLMAGASLHLWVLRIVVWVNTLPAASTVVPFNLYRLSTAGTGGTVGSPGYPHDTTDPATGATYMTMPTALGTETNNMWNDRILVPAAASITIPGSTRIIDWDFRNLLGKPLRVPAGTANGLALKNSAALATATYVGRITYLEATF